MKERDRRVRRRRGRVVREGRGRKRVSQVRRWRASQRVATTIPPVITVVRMISVARRSK